MDENLHKDHRKRVREEFLRNGFDDNTPVHKILELLLFYAIPRKDTNEIAHMLENRFHSLAGILDAPIEQLTEVPGVGESAAILLKLIMPIARRYQADKNEKNARYSSIDDICKFLMNQYFGYNKEVFSISSFSANGKMLGYDVLRVGNIAEVSISTREIIEIVLKYHAVCVVIAHNHPGGTALPSDEDVAVTETIGSALNHINVKLLDHIIIAGDDYVSMAQSRCYQYIFG